MINTNFINKIGAFYPIKLGSNSSHHTFYIDYEKLPSLSLVGFYIVLTGLQLHHSFDVHLTIINDDNHVLIDTDNTINSDNLPSENIIKEKNITTGTFSINPKPFKVPKGIHLYRAIATLKDANGNIYDNVSTWFATRPDSGKNNRAK